MEEYFDGYYLLHKTAIEVMTGSYPKEPIMEDYLSLFPNADAQQLPETDLRERFLEIIQPLLTIASNNGFEYIEEVIINLQKNYNDETILFFNNDKLLHIF
ncbi:hypothetical protein SAMN05421827_111177 [Pedobacter terrae]|uniref:Uncharacterized protein n=1 Tax=Pedobacter terrae TaxID=405671 RepID=A0A1G7XDW4_9SPHI|nr:hypothetical protein [Pedobacter terrae]SDG82465.1 hypothetical protein SAMN05421827_111177 [Pedobacter terrae]